MRIQLVVIALVALSAGLQGAEKTTADGGSQLQLIFDGAAKAANKTDYEAARKQLADLGSKAVPFLRKQAQANDWQRRWLARAVLLEIDDPVAYKRWRVALSNIDTEYTRPDGDDGVEVLTIKSVNKRPNQEDRRPEIVALRLQPGDEIPSQILPLAIDLLRRPQSHKVQLQCRRVLAEFIDARDFEAALKLDLLGKYEVLRVARRLGDHIVPTLKKIPRGLTESELGDHRQLMKEALGTIGSENSVKAILEMKGGIPFWSIKSIPPVLLAEIFKRPITGYNYQACRDCLIRSGEGILPELELIAKEGSPVRRAIARGVIFEIRHPERIEKMYRAIANRYRWLEPWKIEGRRRPDYIRWTLQREFRPNFIEYGLLNLEPELAAEIPPEISLEFAAGHKLYKHLAHVPESGREEAGELLGEALQSIPSDEYASYPVAIAASILGSDVLPYLKSAMSQAGAEGHPREGWIRSSLIKLGDPAGAEIADLGVSPDAKKVAALLRGTIGLEELIEAEADANSSLRQTAERERLRRAPLPERVNSTVDSLVNATKSWDRDAAAMELIGLGEPAAVAVETLEPEARAKAGGNLAIAALADVIRLQAKNPQLVQEFRSASLVPVRADSAHGRAMFEFHHSGKLLAKMVGEPAIPMLRVGLVFDYGSRRNRMVMAFALAELGDNGAIEIISQNYKNLQSSGAAVLSAFGIEALREALSSGVLLSKDPLADPKRHLMVTEAFSRFKDSNSIKMIADGLAYSARTDDLDSGREYVKLAKSSLNKELANPLRQLRGGLTEATKEVNGALQYYRDKNVIP